MKLFCERVLVSASNRLGTGPDYVPKFGEKKVREAAGCGWVHQIFESRVLQFVTHDARLLKVSR